MTDTAFGVSTAALAFTWPDGTEVFDGLQLAVGPGRTGLVGLNGSGKSTLLRLITGELTPSGGTVKTTGELAYLPQNLTLDTTLRVDQALGIDRVRAALHRIERGSVREADFTVLGDDWDVEERAHATLRGLGLERLGLDRTVGEISGGESVLLRLAALLLRRPDVLLLDEPTNNLDRQARSRLYDTVASWRGVLLVVSHDRELLEHVDRIADLRDGQVHWYGGGYTAYRQALAVEQEAAQRQVRAAEGDLDRQKRELVEAQVKLARRKRYGQKMYDTKREPRAVMNERKRQAQVSAGKHRIQQTEKVREARERLDEAARAVREDEEIRVDLPHTAVPAGRTVATLRDLALPYGIEAVIPAFEIRGPERIALTGRNGAGKSTLLRTLAGRLAPAGGAAEVHVPARYLPQRLDLLDDTLSIAENVARFAPAATDNEIRARLARFLFRGARADQPAGTLSGGERFRATTAALLLAQPAPQLLMLDEPTNNLDLAAVRGLTEALACYQGALVVAGHDLPFLRGIGVTRWLRLDGGGLTETDPQ